MRTDILTKTLPVLGLVLASLSYAQTDTENYTLNQGTYLVAINTDVNKTANAKVIKI